MKYTELIKKAEDDLYIIAEAGVNHNGDPAIALEMIDAAVECGCDAIKFQTWDTEKVYSRQLSIKPEYQVRSTEPSETEYETIKKLELKAEHFKKIFDYSLKKNILLFSTPDEIDSANFLVETGVKLLKIASQDVTNIPFLKDIAQIKLPLILSSGASTLPELTRAIDTVYQHNKELILFHCVSSYPTPIEQANIRVLPLLNDMYRLPVGYSDHTLGSAAATAAVALGSTFFEKHFTLDIKMHGPDHQASVDVKGLKAYVESLRNAKLALGDGIKRIMPCEVENKKAFSRFIVAAEHLKAGDILTKDKVLFKKIVSGIEPISLEKLLLNARLKCDIEKDTPLNFNMFSFE